MPLYQFTNNQRKKLDEMGAQPAAASPFDAAFADYDPNAPRAMDLNPVGVSSGVDLNSLEPTDVPDIPVKKPGFFGRIMQQPGGSRALLAMGAELLSNPDFFSGFGRGALAYQTVLDQEADKYRTKLTKDGNFAYRIDPNTGEATMTRTAAGDFESDIVDRKLRTSENNARYGADRRYDSSVYGADSRERVAGNQLEFQREQLKKLDAYRYAALRNQKDIAEINARAGLMEKQLSAGGKPPPYQVQKLVGDYQDIANKSDLTLAQAQPILEALDTGTLELGLVANAAHKARLATGNANDGAILYGQLSTFIESLRNTVLMDARGVQTDGDAERAKAQLLSGMTDAASVRRNLQIVLNNLKQRREFAMARAGDLSSQYGISTPETDAILSAGGAPTPSPSPRPAPSRRGWGKAQVVN